MFIELHIIQNFAPSNLNRDDTNNPKDCVFGGVRRARISSQCLKRAIRTAPAFAQTAGETTGIRSRLMSSEFAKRFTAQGVEQGEAQAVAEAFALAYTKKEKKAKKGSPSAEEGSEGARTDVLVYLSPEEIDLLCSRAMNNWENVLQGNGAVTTLIDELIKETKGRASAPDIALFGRMLAERPETNIDAACQVAHAISTHRVAMDIDFFTAVDDLQKEGETGSAMMGVSGFNSATFYRYARLDLDQLINNLYRQTDTAYRTVEGFLRASVEAIPTGKQNTFAAHNPPSFLLGVVRSRGMGWSLANAFERSVNSGMNGLVAPSVEALERYWDRLASVYGFDGTAAVLALDDTIKLNGLSPYAVEDFETWVAGLMGALTAEVM